MASPTWHSGGTLNTWITLPNSNLSTSGVMETGGGQVIDAWGGAVLVWGGLYIGSTFTAGSFLVCWGGGHTNYGGNEVYAYGPFESNSPTWNKLRAATSPAPVDTDEDGSGNPAARHTYTSLSYVNDGTRQWMVAMGALFVNSSTTLSFNTVHRYNFNQVSPDSILPWAKLADLNGPANISVYDPTLNRIWYHTDAQNNVSYYDVATDTHFRNIYATPIGAGGNCGSALDTSLGIWAWWSSTDGISFYRTNNGVGNDYYVPSTTGTAPTGQGSIIYDPVAAVFRLRMDGDGKKLWTLTKPGTSPYQGGNNWTWSSATPGTGSTPDAGNSQGTFGRFNYSKNADVLGYPLLNSPTGNMYFYKSGASVGATGGPFPHFTRRNMTGGMIVMG